MQHGNLPSWGARYSCFSIDICTGDTLHGTTVGPTSHAGALPPALSSPLGICNVFAKAPQRSHMGLQTHLQGLLKLAPTIIHICLLSQPSQLAD